jgi:hypothetical protein
MRFSVEAWAPEYGIAADDDRLEEGGAPVDATIERPLDQWAPILPTAPAPTATPDRILFVDGVRRIDARIWIHDGDHAHTGVCASVAAGVVTCCGERAEVGGVVVRRGLFVAAASGATPIETRHAHYELVPTADDDPESIYLAIHGQMTALEARMAADLDAEVVVFDGPLRGRNDPRAVGYVKTQHVRYLPEEVAPILGRLGDGERTPLFLIGASGRGPASSLSRYSWYLRLPGPRSQPLAGIVRCELAGLGTVADAIGRADLVSATLPRFASEPHKESRAPQNLYPIAGLEHHLRHRLGDPYVLERSLRRAAAR